MIISFNKLKGGVGATTSAIYLSEVFVKLGFSICLVDADTELSALNWSLAGALSYPVIEAKHDALRKQLKALEKDYDIVIVDTPANRRDIFYATALVSDLVIIPISPSEIEINRLAPSLAIMEEVEETRNKALTTLLYTRYDARRKIAKEAKEYLAQYSIFDTKIKNREVYKGGFGEKPKYTLEYSNLAQEIIKQEGLNHG